MQRASAYSSCHDYETTLTYPSYFTFWRLRADTPPRQNDSHKQCLLKALGLLQWITFIYFHYTIKQQETINFSLETTSQTHKAKAVA